MPPFIFRKKILYGKTKKSTHGHQTTLPKSTHAVPRGVRPSRTYPAPTLYSITYPAPPSRHRSAGSVRNRFACPPAYPVATDLPCTVTRLQTLWHTL